MSEDERSLWERYGQGDGPTRKELILFYLPLVDVHAKHIARLTGAKWEDLRQEGAIGLINAVDRFDPGQGVPFRAFARLHIRGAMFKSSELTREMAREQEKNYRKVRQAEAELTQTLRRNATIEEVAAKTGLTANQIRNAIDARNLHFAGELPESDNTATAGLIESPQTETAIFLREAIANLTDREQQIIASYYWEDKSHEEIARELGLTESNVKKIRQRAIDKLRKRFDGKRKGGQDDD